MEELSPNIEMNLAEKQAARFSGQVGAQKRHGFHGADG
jgi:hypothetical protein